MRPEAIVAPEASVLPAPIVNPDRIVESGAPVDPDVNGAPDTAGETRAGGVDPAFVEIIVGIESEIAFLAACALGRVGTSTSVSLGRFSRRLSSARAPACAESSAIASTAKRRAASRDPL